MRNIVSDLGSDGFSTFGRASIVFVFVFAFVSIFLAGRLFLSLSPAQICFWISLSRSHLLVFWLFLALESGSIRILYAYFQERVPFLNTIYPIFTLNFVYLK